MTLVEAMKALEKAGSAQTRKTYARHGAPEPMFGVSYATLKTLVKKIGVDHALALGLWKSGNFDARNLALKIADPAKMTPKDLSRWISECGGPFLGRYVAMLAGEGPHAAAIAKAWLGSKSVAERAGGWALVGHLAWRDAATSDAWLADRLPEIERKIHAADNAEREAMNQALITIGCRSAKLKKAALSTSKKAGKVDVDHGDTACTTPDAAASIEKAWAYSTSKGYASPFAQEAERESPRIRC
jgi:3-methyladenine DNA glycosylase AlkD